jgi:predicted esterase
VRCTEAKNADGPKGFVRHWVPIPALGSYIVALPPGYAESKVSYPLVVILHGNGSNELNHGRLADKAGREGVIFVVPRAPYPHEQVFTGMGRPGWTWRPQDAEDKDIAGFKPAARYVASIIACVDDAKKRYRVQGERFYVFGHSMGGFFANATAALHPQRVAAYFAYAGGLAEELQTAELLKPLATHGVKAWIVHGKADTVVPPAASEKAFKLLTENGVQANLHLFDDVTHGVEEPVLKLLQSWLKTVVRAAAQLEK